MSVSRIDLRRAKDTIVALEEMLELARAGFLRGLVFSAKTGPGDHQIGFTGDYIDDPIQAVAVSSRLAYKSNLLLTSLEMQQRRCAEFGNTIV